MKSFSEFCIYVLKRGKMQCVTIGLQEQLTDIRKDGNSLARSSLARSSAKHLHNW